MAKAATKSARGPAKTATSAKTKRPGTAAETAARKAVIATALEMSRSGLSPGRSGNVSQRFGTGMLITPSGMAYDTLKPADIVFVAADGAVAAGARKKNALCDSKPPRGIGVLRSQGVHELDRNYRPSGGKR